LAAATFQNTVAVAVAVLLWFFLLIFLFLTMFFPWLLFCKSQQWRYNTSKPVDLQTSGAPSQMKPAIALKASCCLSTSGPTFAFGKLSIWLWCLQNDPIGFNAWTHAFETALARRTVDLQTCGSPNLAPHGRTDAAWVWVLRTYRFFIRDYLILLHCGVPHFWLKLVTKKNQSTDLQHLLLRIYARCAKFSDDTERDEGVSVPEETAQILTLFLKQR
jgi:hypothetical protein